MALKAGFKIDDLDHIEMGLVMDVITEIGNDSVKYKQLASQKDFDNF